MSHVYIVDTVRTPRGKRNGSFAGTHPIDLASAPLAALLTRNKTLDPSAIDDVIYGCVSQRGEQDNVIAREALLAANFPESIPGITVNRFCGSGLSACNWAAQSILSGMHEVSIGGGVEHMTRVPMSIEFKMPGSLFDARYPHLVSQGISAEMIAEQYGFTRGIVDQFAVNSQQKAARAWEEGRFAKSIIPMSVTTADGQTLQLEKDEHMRPTTTVEGLLKLKPSFKETGVIHAGNSSGIVDGAAAVLFASEAACKRFSFKPRGRVLATAVVGSDPIIMLLGPAPATKKALKIAGLKASDIDLFEINEAFAPVPLATAQDLDIPLEKVNVNGGAIALGHPLGATGAMLLGTALDELERTQKRYAVITLCIGLGMGVATVIERV